MQHPPVLARGERLAAARHLEVRAARATASASQFGPPLRNPGDT
jgi:hypothetical protein